MLQILTGDEVAELLRLSPNRVLLLARRGDIPSLLIDRRVRFDAGKIDDCKYLQRLASRLDFSTQAKTT